PRAQVHHCIRTHSRPTDELEAAGLSSLENALFHPRMRSWWRAKAFVLIKAAEPSASSFPRNERNRATGTATDVDPPQQESPPRDQTTTVQGAESAPGSGPAEDSRGIGHSGLSTGGGPRLGRILNDSLDDPQPVTPATFNSSLDLITSSGDILPLGRKNSLHIILPRDHPIDRIARGRLVMSSPPSCRNSMAFLAKMSRTA
ncbi:hypothetical protein CSPX01_06914, partial [Colletotrichum filicis]